MVSRANQVIVGFGVLSIILLYVVTAFTNLPIWVGVAAVIIVGVIIPQLVNSSVRA